MVAVAAAALKVLLHSLLGDAGATICEAVVDPSRDAGLALECGCALIKVDVCIGLREVLQDNTW
jgi:hypothetical protein